LIPVVRENQIIRQPDASAYGARELYMEERRYKKSFQDAVSVLYASKTPNAKA
jgi:hypothetical protein